MTNRVIQISPLPEIGRSEAAHAGRPYPEETTMADAGRINPEWLAAARMNETSVNTVEDWFATVANQTVEIDAEGSVWLVTAGQWMSQEAIDDACKAIDAGL